jgi:hypothetical protein
MGLLGSGFASDRSDAGLVDDRRTHAVPKALLMRGWCFKPVSCRVGRVGVGVVSGRRSEGECRRQVGSRMFPRPICYCDSD